MRLITSVALGLCLGVVGPAAEFPRWQFSTEAIWHDNATNAERPQDVRSALQWRSELRTGIHRAFPGGHRVSGTAGLRTEFWPRFEGLDVVAPGIAGSWAYKPGLGPNLPVFSAEMEGEWALAAERARDGRGGAARLQVRQRVGNDWLLRVGFERRRFDARSHAFDLTGRKWFGRVERTLGENWLVAVEGQWREGTVVSYSRPPRPDLVAIGKPITFVDTFEQDVPWIAYYFRAKTRSGALELQRTVGRSAMVLRHEYRHTLHAGPGYRNQITTLRFVTGF
ncbi:MAG: hypothetical protein PSW75_12740 [bacterium]|nr:hypothetical protein [bacterium]MDI1336638.1 hypothetical protein [Lacunisphaera sp.]